MTTDNPQPIADMNKDELMDCLIDTMTTLQRIDKEFCVAREQLEMVSVRIFRAQS